jgi:hypothetical protein
MQEYGVTPHGGYKVFVRIEGNEVHVIHRKDGAEIRTLSLSISREGDVEVDDWWGWGD